MRKIAPSLPLLLILALAVVVRLVSLRLPFGDYDEGVYLATVRSVSHGAPLLSHTYSSQGPLFIYFSELFYKISPTIQSVRLFPVLCSLATVYFAYKLVDKYIGRLGAIFAATYLSLDTAFLTVSRTFQVDVPWVAFSFASFYFLLRFHESKKRIHIMLSALLFGASLFLKLNPIYWLVIVGYFVLTMRERGIPHLGNFLYFVAAPILLLVLLVPSHELGVFYTNAIGVRASNLAPEISAWVTGFRLILLRHEFWLVLADLAAVVLLMVRFRTKQNLFAELSLLWLAATVAAFSVYSNLFPHHFVFFILPATLLAAYAIQECSRHFVYLAIPIGITAFAVSSIVGILRPTISSYDQKLDTAATTIMTNSKPDDFVICDDQLALYLANRNTPPDLVDTSFVRIQSGLLTESTFAASVQKYKPKLVVYVSGRLASEPSITAYLTKQYYQKELPEGITLWSLSPL